MTRADQAALHSSEMSSSPQNRQYPTVNLRSLLALLMLHCSESYVFDLPAIRVSTLGFDQLLFHLLHTIQKSFLLFKNNHTWSDQRRKDRCVRTGRGTSGLRTKREEACWKLTEQGIMACLLIGKSTAVIHLGEKRSEYRAMQRHFPFLGILPPPNGLNGLQKTSLPDLFPWGFEAMAIKSSPLIPPDWTWGGCHTILTPRCLKWWSNEKPKQKKSASFYA